MGKQTYARLNQLEADRLLEIAKSIERKADFLNISKTERNVMYAKAAQVRGRAERIYEQQIIQQLGERK